MKTLWYALLLPYLVCGLFVVWVVRSVLEDWPYLVGCVGAVLFLAFLTEIALPWLFSRRRYRPAPRE